ncbi:UBC-like protein [Vararia minispora EC-137]|uniref:UBC-like protein n=1 Tax=Vararia minispora EC-137 TaxID=1314806 RepID=A0ACB8QUM8_9AGAM|nr:UBC-like protein [Vararia minispora EC-137]
MSSVYMRRLGKELMDIQCDGLPEGVRLLSADNMQSWFFTIQVLGQSLYEGEVFALEFRFDNSYPFSAPAVLFVKDRTYAPPIHPHVYSNGHICASILGDDWSPSLSVTAVCITLQSMLASCKEKKLPPGNDTYVRTAPDNPKKTRFVYEDDTCDPLLCVS